MAFVQTVNHAFRADGATLHLAVIAEIVHFLLRVLTAGLSLWPQITLSDCCSLLNSTPSGEVCVQRFKRWSLLEWQIVVNWWLHDLGMGEIGRAVVRLYS